MRKKLITLCLALTLVLSVLTVDTSILSTTVVQNIIEPCCDMEGTE